VQPAVLSQLRVQREVSLPHAGGAFAAPLSYHAARMCVCYTLFILLHARSSLSR